MSVFRWLVLACWSFAAVAATPENLAGRYRLVGVMETAAALELSDDRRFRWFLSVGSLDMQAAGKWEYQHGSVVLTADGAEEKLARTIRLQRTSRAREWLPKLPPDHPLHSHPNAVSVRLVGEDGEEATTLFAAVATSDKTSLEWQADWSQDNERWLIADLPEGQVVDWLWVQSGNALPALSREISVSLKPGDVAEVVISTAWLADEPVFLMRTFQVDRDGALIPEEGRLSDPGARYVRD